MCVCVCVRVCAHMCVWQVKQDVDVAAQGPSRQMRLVGEYGPSLDPVCPPPHHILREPKRKIEADFRS